MNDPVDIRLNAIEHQLHSHSELLKAITGEIQ